MKTNLLSRNAGFLTILGLAAVALLVAPSVTAVSILRVPSGRDLARTVDLGQLQFVPFEANLDILRPYPGVHYTDGSVADGVERRSDLPSAEFAYVNGRMPLSVSWTCPRDATEAYIELTLTKGAGRLEARAVYDGVAPRGTLTRSDFQPNDDRVAWAIFGQLFCYPGERGDVFPTGSDADLRNVMWER